ncbi:MAG TPA: hypothetical protein VEI57_10190 [Nitrospirota bacterium]|nr:hypothetical protein [Nitrospirota bacterium]
MVLNKTPLYELRRRGRYKLPSGFYIFAKLVEMLAHIEMTRGLFFTNNASNCVPVRLRMPPKRDRAVTMIKPRV